MRSADHNDKLTGLEIERLAELEAVVRDGPPMSNEVLNSLAEIRDRRLYRDGHESFEDYLQDRWTVGGSQTEALVPRRDERALALATAWDEVLQQFQTDHFAALEVRLTIGQGKGAAQPSPQRTSSPSAELPQQELLPRLRSLLTRSSGTIAAIAHHVETRAADLDEEAREQLRDDLDVLDDDLAMLKALLAAPVDWDAEYGRLLAGEIPPSDYDEDDDEA